jgi:hypothetical protein
MSGRITIDHINNNIVIKPNMVDLSSMTECEIFEWIKKNISSIEISTVRVCRGEEVNTIEQVIPTNFGVSEFNINIIDEYDGVTRR